MLTVTDSRLNITFMCTLLQCTVHVHGKYVYSTLALGKEREIVKEETARKERKKQYAVMYMYMYKLYKDAHNCMYTHIHIYIHKHQQATAMAWKTTCTHRQTLRRHVHVHARQVIATLHKSI